MKSITIFCFTFCFSQEIRDLYNNKFVQLDESRIYVLNTLFNLPGEENTHIH